NMTEKITHHGHAIKRFRHTLGMKQDALASIMGLSQTQVSTYEQRRIINDDMIGKFAKALNIAPELITELEEDPVTTIIRNNSFEEESDTYGNLSNNPVNRVIELIDEKATLYKRILELEQEEIALLIKLSKEKKRNQIAPICNTLMNKLYARKENTTISIFPKKRL
ncbi:MAG: helix-turn-helix domain-containing protein, partial [Suipraeoptans sp.]